MWVKQHIFVFAPPPCVCVCVCGQETRLRWEKTYVSIPSANKGGNMRETAAFRKGATGSEKVRRACWSALLDIEATQRIPSKYQDKWRVDPWGNVVSIHASAMSSVCGFQVDHVSESGRKSREGRVCLTRPLWFDTSHYACPFLFFLSLQISNRHIQQVPICTSPYHATAIPSRLRFSPGAGEASASWTTLPLCTGMPTGT